MSVPNIDTNDDDEATIHNLRAALIEALDWLLIEKADSPYRIPTFIDHDLWGAYVKTRAKTVAFQIIRETVARI